MIKMNKIMVRLKDLFFSREFVRYFFAGVAATIADNAVFALLSGLLGLEKWYLSILPATVVSVVVAYVLNRIWVFHSKSNLFKEFVRFTGTRIAISLFFTYLVYPILYFGLNIQYELFANLPVAKLIALLFVILGNRLSGKFYVFKDEYLPDDAEKGGDQVESGDPQNAAAHAEHTTATICADDKVE